MSQCPACACKLSPSTSDGSLFFHCDQCGGQALTLPTLKSVSGVGAALELWANARPAAESADRRCPECRQTMQTVLAGDHEDVEVDLCRTCSLLWFDGGELESMPHLARARELPADARRALAMAKVEAIGESARARNQAAVVLSEAYLLQSRQRTWRHDNVDSLDVVGFLIEAVARWFS